MVRAISQFTWNKTVEQRIRNAAKKAVVEVGVPKNAVYPNGMKVEDVAKIQEFGSGNVPPRPFARNAIAENKGKWGESAGRKLRKVARKGEGSAKTALRAVGEEVRQDVVRNIETLVDPHLKPSTVESKRKKGRSRPEKPLIDSGLLKSSIKVYDKLA